MFKRFAMAAAFFAFASLLPSHGVPSPSIAHPAAVAQAFFPPLVLAVIFNVKQGIGALPNAQYFISHPTPNTVPDNG